MTPRETMLRELARRAHAAADCAMLLADGHTGDDAVSLENVLGDLEDCAELADSIITLDETADPLGDE